MGLPLFIEPVESDLPKKKVRKTPVSSPPRSAIRRLAHISAVRERASLNRRARAYELSERSDRRRNPPHIDDNDLGLAHIPSSDVATVARYIGMGFMSPGDIGNRDAPRGVRRAALIHNMETRFGLGWQDRDWESPQQDLSEEWWMVRPALDLGQAYLVRLMGPNTGPRPPNDPANYIEIVPSSSWTPTRYSGASNRYSPFSAFSVPPPRERPVPRRPLPNDMNGLGDRERSMSPEVWETLLTTLTPDPQPPSASSSFVSTAASQGVGVSTNASTNTSMSEQPSTTTSAHDPPCESGCEQCETEHDDAPYPRRTHQRSARRVRLGRPEHPVIGSVRFSVPHYNGDGSSQSLALPVPHFSTNYSRHPSPLARPQGLEPDGFTSQPDAFPRQGIWVGHLSVGSDDEPTSDRPETQREERARPSGELIGMQRIVRSLAHREDIPDEWWAEAGLSRTLSREASQ